MPSFEDLGLRAELLRVLEEEDLSRPTALQEAVIPALRRGGNLVARASSGAGKTLAYALGALDRLTAGEDGEEQETALRLLVLVPTGQEAERVALSVFPYAQALGLGVSISGGPWGTRTGAAELLVAPVADVMQAVRGSAVKLDHLETVVIDSAATIATLGGWEQVDALLDLVPRDAQRVLLSSTFPAEVEDLIDRRVKRALRYPAEAALPEQRHPQVQGEIGYVMVSERQKLDALARQLTEPREGGAPPVIFLRNDDRAAELAEQLSVRGFVVGAADDADADVAVATSDATREELAADVEGGLGQSISFDVPPDAATLLARHRGDPDSVVVVEPRQLSHLQEISRAAGLRARPVPLPLGRSAGTEQLDAFRQQLRNAVREEDLGAQLLVLEPLFEEFTAPELAAAAAALLRRRVQSPAPAVAAASEAHPPRPTAAETGGAPAAYARLYVGVGSRDDVRPGDLVGALTGEANVKGSQIGRIDIRDNFSIVEVEAAVADRIIRAVNGTTVKGRSVRVDYDRSGDRARRAGGGGGDRERRPGGRPDTKRRMVRRPPQGDL